MLKNKSKLIIKKLNKKIEKLEQEKEDLYEIAVSNLTDFKNYKKRAAREQLSFKKFANQELLQEMLTIADNVKDAIKYSYIPDISYVTDETVHITTTTVSGDFKQVTSDDTIEGVKIILKVIMKIFKKFNVEPIKAVGQQFDPKFHQVMLMEETDEYPNNTILSELQTGYMIHDRLLRPSMVVVSTPKKEKK